MSNKITMDTKVSLKQAYQVMFEFLDKEWQLMGKSKTDQLGGILGNLSLWETESGNKEPMDGAVFPQWLESAETVLSNDPNESCDIKLDGKAPSIKVNR